MSSNMKTEALIKKYERIEFSSLIIGCILTVTPLFWGPSLDVPLPSFNLALSASSLFISILIYLYAGRLKIETNALASEERHQQRLSEISQKITENLNLIKSQLDGVDQSVGGQMAVLRRSMDHYVEPLGLARDIPIRHADRLMSMASSATRVRNTLVFFASRRDHDGEARQYTGGDNSESRRQLIEAVLKRRVTWMDIYSELGLAYINSDIRKLKDGKYGSYYIPMVLNSSFPVVNFVLFDFPDDRREVWFGFGLFNGVNSSVFRSTSPPLCQYFREYFEVLELESRPWISKGRQYLDGLWVTVSYAERCIASIALINVCKFGDEYKLRGTVFSVIGKDIKSLRRFNSTSCKYSEYSQPSELIFTFRDIENGNDGHRGFGRYSFMDSQVISGFAGQIITDTGASITIYGHKVKSEEREEVLNKKKSFHRLVTEIIESGEVEMEGPTSDDGPFMPKEHLIKGYS